MATTSAFLTIAGNNYVFCSEKFLANENCHLNVTEKQKALLT